MLTHRARYIAPIALLALAAVSGGVAAGAQLARNSAAVVKTAPARVLTNAQGMTLYVFAVDKKNKSSCYGDCAKFWPAATVSGGSTVPSTIAGVPGTFGAFRRTDGSRQLTYDGAPLYTWSKDKKPGDMTGQGVAGVWWAVGIPAAAAISTWLQTPTEVPTGSLTPTQTPDTGATPATPTPSGGYHGGGY